MSHPSPLKKFRTSATYYTVSIMLALYLAQTVAIIAQNPSAFLGFGLIASPHITLEGTLVLFVVMLAMITIAVSICIGVQTFFQWKWRLEDKWWG